NAGLGDSRDHVPQQDVLFGFVADGPQRRVGQPPLFGVGTPQPYRYVVFGQAGRGVLGLWGPRLGGPPVLRRRVDRPLLLHAVEHPPDKVAFAGDVEVQHGFGDDLGEAAHRPLQAVEGVVELFGRFRVVVGFTAYEVADLGGGVRFELQPVAD